MDVDQLRRRLIRLENLKKFALEMVLDPSYVELYFSFMHSSCEYRGCSLGNFWEIFSDSSLRHCIPRIRTADR